MTVSYISFNAGQSSTWHKGLFGAGSDGNVTLAANTPLLGIRSYNNLTIPAGLEMRIYDLPAALWATDGGSSVFNTGTSGDGYTCFFLRVKDTLRIGGKLSGNGINAGAGGANSQWAGWASASNYQWGDIVPGNTGARGTLYCGQGRNGAGAPPANGPGDPVASHGTEKYYCGGLGGNGGDCAPFTGAAGNVAQVYYPFPHFVSDYSTKRFPTGSPTTTYSMLYAGGCGGGGAGGTGDSGGGGSGGCAVVVYAKNIILESTGLITSNGGNGATASGANGGGGGGGGGGVVALYYETLTIESGAHIYVNGGAGGALKGTGLAGAAGSVGKIYTFNCLTGEFENRSAEYA